jgi:hypothetical protein
MIRPSGTAAGWTLLQCRGVRDLEQTESMAVAGGENGPAGLEPALSELESAADVALKAAAAVTAALKRVRTAAQVGNLRDVAPTLEAAERAVVALRQAIDATASDWSFDADSYFAGGAFVQEVLEMAAQQGLQIFAQDERLYAYPALVEVQHSERAVLIDKRRERRVRPSVLVRQLKDLQGRQPHFRHQVFLEALFEAYVIALDREIAKHGPDHVGQSGTVRLLAIYELLTLRPGQAREYSRQEFARDIYLLQQSGAHTTRRGYRVRFPASTGTRQAGGTLRIITQQGQEKLYYGIAFDDPPPALA